MIGSFSVTFRASRGVYHGLRTVACNFSTHKVPSNDGKFAIFPSSRVGNEDVPRKLIRVSKDELKRLLMKEGDLNKAVKFMKNRVRHVDVEQSDAEMDKQTSGDMSDIRSSLPVSSVGILSQWKSSLVNDNVEQSGENNKSCASASSGTHLGKTMRLNKLIANAGLASRREAENMIKDARVSVNGTVIVSVSYCIDPVMDTILVDGLRLPQGKDAQKRLQQQQIAKPRLWAVHKLGGELVSSRDAKKRPLMLDRVKKLLNMDSKIAFKPVIHLEFHTQGICLVSNNGSLARYIGSKQTALERTYKVRIHGLLTDSKLKAIRMGPTINGVKYSGMDVRIDRQGKSTISYITLTLRDMQKKGIQTVLEYLHIKALKVMCIGVGPFKLDNLPPGAVMELEIPKEIQTGWLAS